MAASQVASALGKLGTVGANDVDASASGESSHLKSASASDFGAALAGVLFALAGGVNPAATNPALAGAATAATNQDAPRAVSAVSAAPIPEIGRPQVRMRGHGVDPLASTSSIGLQPFSLLDGGGPSGSAKPATNGQSAGASMADGAAALDAAGRTVVALVNAISGSVAQVKEGETSVTQTTAVNIVSSALSNGAPTELSAAPEVSGALQSLAKTVPSPKQPFASENRDGQLAASGVWQSIGGANTQVPVANLHSGAGDGKTAPGGSAKPSSALANKSDSGEVATESFIKTAQVGFPKAAASQGEADPSAKTETALKPVPESAHNGYSVNDPATSPSAHREPINTVFTNSSSAPEESAPSNGPVPAAPTAHVTGYPPEIQQGRVANLQVTLGEGHNAQATIRETSGAVDVKIVAPDQGSAQRIAGEMDTLRNALGGAGLRLRAAQVNYRNDSEHRGQSEYFSRQSKPQDRNSGEIFTVEEVK